MLVFVMIYLEEENITQYKNITIYIITIFLQFFYF